jgi:glucose-6-phosphate 1-dehydrogenase
MAPSTQLLKEKPGVDSETERKGATSSRRAPGKSSPPDLRTADPCAVVIFGASGDLARRKLLPSFYNLASDRLLPDDFAIVGFARSDLSTDQFREAVRENICTQHESEEGFDSAICDWILDRTSYVAGDYRDASRFHELRETLLSLDQTRNTRGNYLFYLATPPDLFLGVVKQLDACGLARQQDGQWRRFIIEKPFGSDLRSAQSLNRELLHIVSEEQIYRIDHYLGKETVQNILVFRFSNSIFEPVWNRQYVDHIQITVAETLGVEHRGDYYDKVGALRDMVPSHMMQLVSLTAMEPPVSFQADAVRDEQTKALHAVLPLTPEDVLASAVRGQYGEGVIDGQRVPAYRSEPRVNRESGTETFVALRLFLDNWRWAGVPFYLQTGKRLAKRESEIVIQFRQTPTVLFRDTPSDQLRPNTLVMSIQPKEAISLSFGAKMPGPKLRVAPVNMNFCYADYFKSESRTGYERLLYDCMVGDATLFQRADMVETGWAIVDPVLDVWEALRPRKFPNYAAGTWGPPEALELLRRDGTE